MDLLQINDADEAKMLLELNAYDQSRAIDKFFKNQKEFESDDDKDYESGTDEEELDQIKNQG